MTRDRTEYVPRRPRHPSAVIEAELTRRPGSRPGHVKAQLVDLSRDGFQLRIPVPLDVREAIVMQLGCESACFRLTVEGVVQWQSAESSGTWLIGCRSLRTLDLETLGELFLHGILAAD